MFFFFYKNKIYKFIRFYFCLCYCLELCFVGSYYFYEIICIMDILKIVVRDGWFDNKMVMEVIDKCSVIIICFMCSCLIFVDIVCYIL